MRFWVLLLLVCAGCAGEESSSRLSIEGAGERATVLVFLATDCPIANGYAPELARLDAEFTPQGVAFRRVYTQPELDAATVRAHGEEYGLDMPALVDADLELVHRTGVRVSPEAVVLDAEGERVYRGRIDDVYVDFGQRRSSPSRRDLREALEAVVAGRAVEVPETTAIGCSLPTVPEGAVD